MLKEIIGKDYIVIDDAIPRILFNKLKTFTESGDFPWYFTEYTAVEGLDDSYSFSHVSKSYDFINSMTYPLCESALYAGVSKVDNLNVSDIGRCRIGMFIKKKEKTINTPHIDDHLNSHVVALLYLNDSNGETYLHKEKYDGSNLYTAIDNIDMNESIKIECKENRMILFDGNIFHSSSNQTDVTRRIAINYNFKA